MNQEWLLSSRNMQELEVTTSGQEGRGRGRLKLEALVCDACGEDEKGQVYGRPWCWMERMRTMLFDCGTNIL